MFGAWGRKARGSDAVYAAAHLNPVTAGDGFMWGSFNCLNIVVCDSCDGDDVKEKWAERTREFFSDKFWQLRRNYCE